MSFWPLTPCVRGLPMFRSRYRCGLLSAAAAAAVLAVMGPTAAAKQSGAASADNSVRTVRSISRTTTVTATVDAIDLDNRTVALREPNGRTVTLKVGDRVKNLPQVHVGDQ